MNTSSPVNSSNAAGLREHMLAYLREADVRCPGCGYSLRGCAGERCPECGAAFSLGLIITRTSSMWWYAALLGAIASAAMAAWLVFRIFSRVIIVAEDPTLRIMVERGMAPRSVIPNWTITVTTTLLMLATLLLLAAILASRRRFALWPARVQFIWGALALASPLAVLGIVALLPRLS